MNVPYTDEPSRTRSISIPDYLARLAERHGVLLAIGSVVTATAAFLPFRNHLAHEQWGWPYLLIVGAVAGTAGVRAAVTAACLAFLCWNFFFIPPAHTFKVADTGDLLHIVAFLMVAIAVGLQTGRLRSREAAAVRDHARSSALYRLSSRLVTDIAPAEMLSIIDDEVRSLAGHCSVNLALADAPQISTDADTGGDDPRRFKAILKTSDGASLLDVQCKAPIDTADREFLSSVAHLVTAHLENRRMAEIALNAAAERETERLRTALVSSVSHELKSPLASLKASVTDVLDRVPEPDVSETRAILARANADLTRLDRSIGDLLDTSRLEARAWQPQTLEFEVGDAVGTAVHDLTDESRERLHYSIPRNLPLLLADFGQVCRAMRHLIDNALTYAEGTITVSAAAEGEGTVTIRVHDRGPGLSSTEKERVFDKFFRGTAGIASSSSTGLGLSLARDLIEANGGRIWTEEVLPHGAVFAFELPAGGTAEDLGGLHG